MPSLQAEQAIEEKMDRVEEILEELVLDAVISVLLNVLDRYQLFAKNHHQCNCDRNDCNEHHDIRF